MHVDDLENNTEEEQDQETEGDFTYSSHKNLT